MKKFITSSGEETKQFAATFAKKFKRGTIALIGELGSGKTTFVQGFAKGLGIKDSIISPTFILIRQYPISKRVLYHIDLYRIENFQGLGLNEILENPNNTVLIEWAEKLKYLPKGTIKISIQKEGLNKRSFLIEPALLE